MNPKENHKKIVSDRIQQFLKKSVTVALYKNETAVSELQRHLNVGFVLSDFSR